MALIRSKTAWLVGALAGSALFACAVGDPVTRSSNAASGGDEPTTSAEAGSDASPETPAESDPGSVTIRRLNAAEYNNTVRDLVGDTSQPASSFPPDDGAYGFTNIGDALNVSPLLMEKYELSASRLAALAIANPNILICQAANAPEVSACATQILKPFVRRAWRRKVTAEEIENLAALVTGAFNQGVSFPESVRVAIKAALMSPNFLFRIEVDEHPEETGPHPINDYELASRLSYFLWSTMPDDALFEYADANKLSDPRILDRQVRRMLADPKAEALIDDFATEWLLHSLSEREPDAALFPSFDGDLRAAMAGETREFLRSFLFEDESLPDMFDANFSYLNERIATHYGIGGVNGSTLVRVSLPTNSHRGGILTHASLLTMTSLASRTSVVRRGAWILETLLCAPPPPPPPDVPPLPVKTTSGTQRERLDEHRKNPMCNSCHSQMDPLGFALEHYDAIGRWRSKDDGLPIDATGKLPTGETFDGAAELAQVLKADPRFVACATRKLFTYALGRVPASYDERRIASLVNAFAKDKYRMHNLIVNIIGSDAFRMRRGK